MSLNNEWWEYWNPWGLSLDIFGSLIVKVYYYVLLVAHSAVNFYSFAVKGIKYDLRQYLVKTNEYMFAPKISVFKYLVQIYRRENVVCLKIGKIYHTYVLKSILAIYLVYRYINI